jgi:photosystem II stability/assembly factor-like uncharacterized protein
MGTCALRLAAVSAAFVVVAGLTALSTSQAQESAAPSNATIDPSLYSSMRWRSIGPYRGGRVSAVAGIPGNPAVYYMGTPGGGVWKSVDGGRVWNPIFDEQRVASIGAIAIAPSDPNIIYVGTGEQTDGNGVYKSIDGGATWTHAGLEGTRYISSIVIDPHNPDVVLVGVLDHPILSTSGPDKVRGIYKSTDGGKTWAHTLFKDDMSGVTDISADPGDPNVLFAAMWHPYDWAGGATPSKDPDAWLYKSTDEGSTWTELRGTGLPHGGWDRIGVAVAPETRGQRVYTIIGSGLYRSDDGGSSWEKSNNDARVAGNFYFSRVYVDPRDPDVVYVMQTSMYRSKDGGKTFAAFKGAPGGDDYHVLWIDPRNSERMILGVDQGATISVDGGKSWSSWYNQPTGQFYHVITDKQFPYISYAPQQDSGTVAVPNRSDYGEISFRDWFSIGGFEYCQIAPDPLDSNIVYSGGWYGSVVRFDKATGQINHVFVKGSKYRVDSTAPLVYSPHDPHTLFFGTQYLMKTTNGGATWQEVGPDLGSRHGDAEGKPSKVSLAKPAPYLSAEALRQSEHGGRSPMFDNPGPHTDPDSAEEVRERETAAPHAGKNGALTAISPSILSPNIIWVGTNNGIVQRTADGGATWSNVSPAYFTIDFDVSMVEASHFDENTAYVSAIVPHDAHPYIYRTRDAGKTWQKISSGLADGWMVYVVREDTVRKNLLYAGTENAVYVSFDGGDHWQSLELNLPTATIRDLVVHDDDIVVATYGRALWILDDISLLRQADPQTRSADAALMKPARAIRVRWDNDQETPLPPETPAGKNPPDGAVFDYWLKSVPAGPVTLEISDAQGNLVKRFTSEPPKPDETLKNVPDYWFEPLVSLPKNQGMNRFVWNLRYDSPPTLPFSYWGNMIGYVEYTLSDHAIPEETPREQTLGPIAVPGKYEVTLTVDGKKYQQTLDLALDPRVHASQADLTEQLVAGKRINAGLTASSAAYLEVLALQDAIADQLKSLEGNAAVKDVQNALKELDKKTDEVQEGTPSEPGFGPANRDLARLSFFVLSGDSAPSASAKAALDESCGALNKSMTMWREMNAQTVRAVNSSLEKSKLAALPVAAVLSPSDACSP